MKLIIIIINRSFSLTQFDSITIFSIFLWRKIAKHNITQSNTLIILKILFTSTSCYDDNINKNNKTVLSVIFVVSL